MIYSDSSFIVSLVSSDFGTSAAQSTFRSLGRPRLFFSDLHEMEVRNALRAVQFIETTNSPAKRHSEILVQRQRSEARLNHMLKVKALHRHSLSQESVISTFETLSAEHTPELGVRTLDIMHVANVLLLGCQEMITCDVRQAALARAVGLKVRLVEFS